MGLQPSYSRRSGIALLLMALAMASHMQQASALYHTSSELLHWFSRWAAKRPDVLRFRELHERQTSTILPVATISKGIISPDYKLRPAVLFVFGEHAREVITPEVGIWLARALVDTNSSIYSWPELSAAFERAGVDASGRTLNSSNTTGAAVSAAAGSSTGSSTGSSSGSSGQVDWPSVVRGWVGELLDAVEVVIVPIEALDSRRLVEAGQLCVRKTASNVDLNRNWPYAWKKEAATDEQYGGPNPFSEPQSRLMKHLMDHLTGRLLGYVNVHSGEWALYTPWDSKEAYGPGLPTDLPDLVGKVGRLCDCKAGPAGAVSGYLAYGTSMDYLYVHKRVPYPLTVEVYGGGNIGKLGAGERNQELTAWPTVTKSGAPTTAAAQFQRRLLQQQQQEGERDLAGPSWTGWLRRLLQAPAAGEDTAAANAGQQAAAVEQPPLLPQQQQGQRRRHRQQRLTKPGLLPDITAAAGGAAAGAGVAAAEAEPSSSTDASTGAATATPEPVAAAASLAAAAAGEVPVGLAGGLAPAAGSGFSAGGVGLEQLRQQAKQQLLQQPIRGRTAPASLSIANEPLPSDQLQQQQGGEGGQEQDAILSMVTAAAPHQRSCFDAFNPVTEPEYRRVVADWLAASLIMMKHMVAGEEGQKMIAQVAAGAGQGQHGRVGSKGQQASGISVREPVGTNSSAAFLGGH